MCTTSKGRTTGRPTTKARHRSASTKRGKTAADVEDTGVEGEEDQVPEVETITMLVLNNKP